MSVDKPVSSDWQVPDYVVRFQADRNHDACVIIPVINEGVRITHLLDKMVRLSIDSIADIIIVDGGSTDGSLDEAKLRLLRTNSLLVKTGPGKLSSQLRCAYAYALQRGYEHFITIDGNDKDDPAAIPAFITALKSGIDFVQASRFLPGGVAENTPFLRNAAIRLIHAPMLSLFSGQRWTDTTQGFRGYSRKLLLEPRIAPFRDVFRAYELLAYISYRAPRVGCRCVELPAARRYPAGEVPTKISSVRGNVALMMTLIRSCLGKYNPLTES